MKTKSTVLLSLLSLIFITSCGGGGGGSDSEDSDLSPTNPITSTQFFGENGNLYKPRSDDHASGAGNLVILLSPQFTTRFDTCEIKKNDGTVASLLCIDDQDWTQIPFSCFSNGGRQTWRATFPCNEAGEVRVVCRDLLQEVTFTVPDTSLGQVCGRFG